MGAGLALDVVGAEGGGAARDLSAGSGSLLL